jgi:hypothetical protein
MSELVSNSVRHAGAQPTGGLGLDVAFTPQSIRLEVRDLGRVFVPTERDTPLGSPTGVSTLARGHRWGVAPGHGSTSVWLKLDRGDGSRREESASTRLIIV